LGRRKGSGGGMTDFTVGWLWPQWAFVWLMFITFTAAAIVHGKPRMITTGENKGEPEKYNAFLVLARVVLLLFILICGGFFR
jgi:hypothetical protein